MFKSINKLTEGTFVRLLDRHGKERHLMASRRLDIGDGSGYDMLPQIETNEAYLIINHPDYDDPACDTNMPFPTPWLVYDMNGGYAAVWWVATNDNWNHATSPALLHPCRLN